MAGGGDDLQQRRAVEDRIAQACNVVRRADWGARPPAHPLEPDWSYNAIVVHHTGHETYQMRDIQALDIDHRHWDDFAYHYAVGKDGRIYEGRELVFKASHVLNQNTGKIGIVCLGDYDTSWRNLLTLHAYSGEKPEVPMLASVKRLSQVLAASFPITAFGGHREFGFTDTCPGSELLPKIVEMRAQLGLQTPTYRRP